MPEIIEQECPFCKEGKIKILHREETYSFQRPHASSNVKTIPKISPEKYEVFSEKCPNCGKSKKELEKALEKGKEPSREDVIKRLREAGLDPSKLK